MSKETLIKTGKMYLCYYYYDYHKEFEVCLHKIFAEQENAIIYARGISDVSEGDDGTQYVNHKGELYDTTDGGYGHIAVDSVDTYLTKDDIKAGTKMYYSVYAYWDYYKPMDDISVKIHAAFDDKEKALKWAADLGDGEESQPNYALTGGALFDQSAKEDSYWRIAVDPVVVGV